MGVKKEGEYWRVDIQRNKKRLSTTANTRAEAEALQAQFIEQHKHGRIGKPATYTVKQAFVKWIKEEVKGQKAEKQTLNHIAQLYPFMEGKNLEDIGKVWDEYREFAGKERTIERWGRKKTLPPVSINTMNKKGAALRRVANLAHKEWGWLDKPVYISMKTPPKSKKITIKKESFDEFIAAIPREDARAMTRILFYSGKRIGEILRIRIEGDYFVLDDTKNGKADRTKIHPDLKEDIKHIPFIHGYKYYWTYFKAGAIAIGRPELTPHKMRHSFASHMLNKGVPLKVVQQLLNHSSIAVTADMYGDMYNDTLDKAIDDF